MKTQLEILARIEKLASDESEDFFGFKREALIDCLDFEHARAFLKMDVTPDKWPTRDRAFLVSNMRNYMAFAWTKVARHRGISAGRSIEKMSAWLWALDDNETLKKFEDTPYPQYGAPQLKVVCDAYEFPVPDDDNLRLMIAGLPCTRFSDSCGCDR